MSATALAFYLIAVATVFGGRSWLHRRRTGSSGFHGISGTPGSPRWWAGVLFVLATVLGAAAPALAVTGTVTPAIVARPVAVLGLVLMVVGFACVLVAQSGMGDSWRIGVDQGERTELVTGGVFGSIRNPIFSAMVLVLAGLVLVVPTWLSVSALGCLVAAVQLQVRLIEEPYLLGTHGAAYRRYASRAGRFVPAVGRLRYAGSQVRR